MTIEIIPNKAALFLNDGEYKVLVIADLHLTGENDSVYKIISDVEKLIKNYNPNILVVNGDAFNFGMGGEDVEKFEDELSKYVKVEFVWGNHDPDVFPLYVQTNNYCITHGEFDPKKNQHLILAHTHPYLDNKRVFLQGELKDGRKFTILPPFNNKALGPDIKQKHQLLGFIFANDLIKECFVYNLEGKKIAKLN